MSETSRLAEALTDRCTIDRKIGRGGMATVYLAQRARGVARGSDLPVIA
jgi:hypothetical protein